MSTCAVCGFEASRWYESLGDPQMMGSEEARLVKARARQRALLDGMRAIRDKVDNYDGDPLDVAEAAMQGALAAYLAADGKLEE